MNIIDKNKHIRVTLFFLSATIFLCTLCIYFSKPQSVFAQANIQATDILTTNEPPKISLTVSPPVSYLHVAPGAAVQHTIILENSGETPITVLPEIVDFTTDGKSGRAVVTNTLTFPYISLGIDNSMTEVTIPAQKKAQLTLYISVPKDAEEKEYPLTILFFSKTDQDTKPNVQNASIQTNSQISAAIGSNLIILVAEKNIFTKTLSVVDFNAPLFVDSFQKIAFSPLIKNESLGAVAASGSAKIVNWRKQTIAEFSVYPDTILGHNTREIRALLSNANKEKPEIGSFSFKPTFLLGPYQIVLTLTNENGNLITQSVHVFYAIPIALLIVCVIGIAFFFYLSKTKPKLSEL